MPSIEAHRRPLDHLAIGRRFSRRQALVQEHLHLFSRGQRAAHPCHLGQGHPRLLARLHKRAPGLRVVPIQVSNAPFSPKPWTNLAFGLTDTAAMEVSTEFPTQTPAAPSPSAAGPPKEHKVRVTKQQGSTSGCLLDRRVPLERWIRGCLQQLRTMTPLGAHDHLCIGKREGASRHRGLRGAACPHGQLP